MLSKIFLSLAVTTALWLPLNGEAALELTDQFGVTQRIFSFRRTFDIQSESRKLGMAVKRVFAWGATYDIYDAAGTRVGIGSRRVFSWGATIDVTDASGNKLGTIKEQTLKSLLSWSTWYEVLDKDGKQVGESEKFQFGATDFTIRDRKSYVICTIHRKWLRLVEHWNMSIADSKAIDPRVLVMIPIHKSDRDADK